MSSGSDKNEIILLLLGKVGVGKSSVGNTILGLSKEDGKSFNIAEDFDVGTTECELKTGKYKDFEVKVLDTPGCLRDDDAKKEKWLSGIQKIHPGPHAIIWVLESEEIKREDLQIITAIKKGFDLNYVILVYTKRDQSESAAVCEKQIGQVFKRNPKQYPKLLFFDNTKADIRKQHAEQLLDIVIDMKKENEDRRYISYYGNDVLKGDVDKFFEELLKGSPVKSKSKDMIDELLNITLDVAEGKLSFSQGLKKLLDRLLKDEQAK